MTLADSHSSGESLTGVSHAAHIVRKQQMGDPTIVVPRTKRARGQRHEPYFALLCKAGGRRMLPRGKAVPRLLSFVGCMSQQG